jgi:hypothetical protein
MCRHPALYVQIGADLEVVKWVRNGYELKLKRWPQDSVTKNSRQALPLPYYLGLQTRSDCCFLPELMENKSYISLTSTLIHKLSSSSAEACWMKQTEYKYRVCIKYRVLDKIQADQS